MEEGFAKESEEPPLFVQTQTETMKQEIEPIKPLEPPKDLNQSQIVYVPLIVDKASKQFIHPYSVLVNVGWKFDKMETDNLELPDGVGGLAVEDYYEPETVRETFKNDTYNCQSVKYDKVDHIPSEISNYINQLYSAVKEKGEEYVRFDELESQVIDGITYKFVKNPGNINLNDFTSLNIYLKKGEEEISKLDTLEKFLSFDLPIGYGLVEHAPELGKVYTGMTKDNLIKYLKEENQRKDQIISELQNPNMTFDDGVPQR